MNINYKLSVSFIVTFSIFLLTSCGGGGGGGTPPTPILTPSGFTVSAKVIDGYIEGSNLYIDFNWNLQQDEGEPSAVDDGEGSYYFDSTTFDAIENVSNECTERRLMIAEVPVGAVDSNRGTVDEAFTMYYVPGIPRGGIVNISPFTGLFLDIVSSVKADLNLPEITVANGCGSNADAIADDVIAKVIEFVEELDNNFGITMSALYDDYIASNNAERSAKAEKIVTFLQAAQGIRNAVKNHFAPELGDDFEPYVGLSTQAADQLFGPNFESVNFLEMSIGFHFNGEADAEGWYPTHLLHTEELKVFENGMITNYACTPVENTSCSLFDPTFENILNQLRFYLSYGGHENNLIIPDVKIASQYRDAKLRDGEELECQFQAMLIFYDETGTCTDEGCPDQIDVQSEISHNIGVEYPAVCTSHDNPYFYTFISRKNTWKNGTNEEGNTEDSYGIQYRFVEDSNLFSDPPLDFLGADRSSLNYPVTYSKIKELFITMDSASTIQSSLLQDEWAVISRAIYGENRVRKNDYHYVFYGDGRNVCKLKSWDGSEWVIDSETEGIGAFSACYDIINAFKFYD